MGPSRVPTEPRPSRAVGQGSTAAPRAHPALCPCRARCQRLLAAPQGCAGRGGRGRAWAVPGKGAEPGPTLPCHHSLQLAQDRSRAAEHLRQALPYLQSPQEPLREAAIRFMGEPGLPPCFNCHSSAPAPPAGAVTGSVFTGIAGVLMKGQKEELQLLSEGE